ncbi:hypothetical protein BSU04_38840 [Caballeronia sordidicola]|uniref:Uncharacterized protein n=1 Tax=Caballeronia sordidicola TaxID=196367 RepID=A0A226WQG3_CABSO|nr:hypothetical protein BSU04_38840 [Caballeronia sordidicola]
MQDRRTICPDESERFQASSRRVAQPVMMPIAHRGTRVCRYKGVCQTTLPPMNCSGSKCLAAPRFRHQLSPRRRPRVFAWGPALVWIGVCWRLKAIRLGAGHGLARASKPPARWIARRRLLTKCRSNRYCLAVTHRGKGVSSQQVAAPRQTLSTGLSTKTGEYCC